MVEVINSSAVSYIHSSSSLPKTSAILTSPLPDAGSGCTASGSPAASISSASSSESKTAAFLLFRAGAASLSSSTLSRASAGALVDGAVSSASAAANGQHQEHKSSVAMTQELDSTQASATNITHKSHCIQSLPINVQHICLSDC